MKREISYFIFGLLVTTLFFTALTNHEKIKLLLNSEISKTEKEYQEKICKTNGTEDKGAFCIDWNNLFQGGSQFLCPQLCKGIEELVGDSSVADFGAGLGQYGRCLLRKLPKENEKHEMQFWEFIKYIKDEMKTVNLIHKPPVIKSYEGFDGGINAEEVSDNLVKHVELAKPFDLGKTYEWVISLEVGEHIPKEYESIYIDNVIRHAKIGIITSWAVPGQGGYKHINEQSNEYIANAFTTRGLTHDQKSQDFLRNNIIEGNQYSYFKNTLLVFRKKDN